MLPHDPIRSRLQGLLLACLWAGFATTQTPAPKVPVPARSGPAQPAPAGVTPTKPATQEPAPAPAPAAAARKQEPDAKEREKAELDAAARQRAFRRNQEGVALDGYDPLSYHEKGGPVLGAKEHAFDHRGIVYWFTSEEHRAAFAAAPDRYEPPYGGWCAYAVIDGDKVEVDPTNFAIEDGKVLLFYKGFWGDALQKWQRLTAQRTSKKAVASADEGWQRIFEKDRDAVAEERQKEAKARAEDAAAREREAKKEPKTKKD